MRHTFAPLATERQARAQQRALRRAYRQPGNPGSLLLTCVLSAALALGSLGALHLARGYMHEANAIRAATLHP
jgi:hypothetical protein